MSSVALFVGSLVWLIGAYLVYGRRVARRLGEPDDSRPTPAHAQNDGVDFYPAKPLVLFGHHFSSIAGAGPILGPVFACAAFGWAGALIWLLVGVVFIGAVHDYLSLVISIRHRARSTADVASEMLGRRARLLFLWFVWITLILIVAVFADTVRETVETEAEIVVPTFGLIAVAIGFGWLVYRLSWPLPLATIVAGLAVAGLFWVGFEHPLTLHVENTRWVWIGIFLLYSVIAASLPVWLLLQPRDYLSSWILFGGIGLAVVGLVASRPEITAPAFNAVYDGGEGGRGPVWPMLFILVACGAISGFHTLVASGTTARQISKESHGLPVAFGGMLMEGLLAVLVVASITAGASVLSDGGAPISAVEKGGAGALGIFGDGYGAVVASLVGFPLGKAIGIVMVNAFVLTTLDTSVRIARFATAELFGDAVPLLRNRWIASALVVGLAGAMLLSGGSRAIWPVFGAANQLMAALALIVITAWLLGRGRPTAYTLGPCVFMLVTTIGALVWQAWRAFTAVRIQWTIGIACAVLLGLALLMVHEALAAFRAIRSRTGAAPAA